MPERLFSENVVVVVVVTVFVTPTLMSYIHSFTFRCKHARNNMLTLFSLSHKHTQKWLADLFVL